MPRFGAYDTWMSLQLLQLHTSIPGYIVRLETGSSHIAVLAISITLGSLKSLLELCYERLLTLGTDSVDTVMKYN